MSFDAKKFISFDLETWGAKPGYSLQPARMRNKEAWITSLAYVSQPSKGQWEIHGGLAPSLADLTRMLETAIENDQTIIGWNLVFDISWLVAAGVDLDLIFRCRWCDGMKIKRHALNDEMYGRAPIEYGLKETVAALFPLEAGYEAEIDFAATDDESLERLHTYNINDTIFAFRATEFYWNKLSERQLNAALIEAECLPLVAQMNVEGLDIDVAAAQALDEKLSDDIAAALEDLAKEGATEKIIASPKQLGELLFDTWGLPCTTTTETGARSTNADVLHELGLIDSRVALIQKVRELKNLRKKYVENVLASVEYNGDGKSRPTPSVNHTYTGRFSYNSKCSAHDWNNPKKKSETEYNLGFGVHQMPRGKEFRALVTAPPGHTILEFDAANQEYRFFALMAQDPTMMTLCGAGHDPHGYMGAAIAGRDYDELRAALKAGDPTAKSARGLGKVANLSLQYETSPERLLAVARTDYNLDMTGEEARRIHSIYHQTYPGVAAYWAKQKALAQRIGFVENAVGRRVYLSADWNSFGYGRMMSATAVNFPIQGLGACQKYLALKYLKPYLRKINARMFIDLHDGIYLAVPDACVDQALIDIRDILNGLPYGPEWGWTPDVPLPWDAKVGRSWGELKEHKFDVEEAVAVEAVVEEAVAVEEAVESAGSPKSNLEFIKAIFGEHWRRAPVSSGRGYSVTAAEELIENIQPLNTNYYALSLFDELPGVRLRRIEPRFITQHCLMVDDINTKLSLEVATRLLPRPSYKLETSPGNFQFGYKLIGGCNNVALLGAIIYTIIKNPELNPSGSDPGMAGVTRVARLPFGANHKAPVMEANGGRPWPHVMREWNLAGEYGEGPGSVSYTAEEIADALGVDRSAEALGAFKGRTYGSIAVREEDRAADDILALFDKLDMIIDGAANDAGFITVQCPWSAEHTDGRVEAGYRVGKGGFQCFHGHCTDRGMTELRAWAAEALGPEERRELVANTFDRAGGSAEAILEGEILEGIIEEATAAHRDWVFIDIQGMYGRIEDRSAHKPDVFNKISGIAAAGRSGMRSAVARFHNEGGRRVHDMSYVPGHDVVTRIEIAGLVADVFNRWRPGPVPIGGVCESTIRHWLDHVEYILPDPVARNLFLNWAAFLIQQPGKKCNWAYVLKGAQGIGKDLMLRPIVKIIGTWNCSSVSVDVIEGQFNDWLESQLIILEELPSFKKKSVYDRLKAYISVAQDMMRVNQKNQKPYNIPNCQNWFCFTNHDDALALEPDDRRFFVYATDAKPREAEYYQEMGAAYASAEFMAALHGWLRARDLKAFDPYASPPWTKAKREMVAHAKSEAEIWLDEQLDVEGNYYTRSLISAKELTDAAANNNQRDVSWRINHKLVVRSLREYGWEPLYDNVIRLPNVKDPIRLWVKGPKELYLQMDKDKLAEAYIADRARGAGIEFRKL